MKIQVIKFLALCAIVSGFVANASAQTSGNPKPLMTATQQTQMHLNKMKTSLKLTNAQIPQVQALLYAEAVADSSNNKQAMKEAHAKMSSQLNAILTPAQMAKYKQMMVQRKQQVN